ncbi:neural-cadherin-like isoform X1 [Amphibalanus amphitrite]|uniref:neural-cadherin-like isoform X1 n=2 Tax=Amphibalanus amphitrite TaxID=1232801 RepID=UPI001C92A35A|nr:neural-cadherin-like isoform X1 [Amphibalanus amphitrite]
MGRRAAALSGSCLWILIVLLLAADHARGGDARRRRRRNENIPSFEQKLYTIRSVTGDTKNNTFLIRVAAPDANNVRFSLDNPRLFRIDSNGNIFSNANGHRLVASGGLNFTVFAVNPDHSHRVASATVVVAGNQPPQFSDQRYQANVYENAGTGSLVSAVVAQDPDTDPISYFIRAPGSTQDAEVYKMFSINRQTGVIRLVGPASPLTQHSEENFTFTVVARDTHNLNDTATVHVHVIDVNNNRPVFPLCAQYRPEVEENKGVGTAVLRLEATDADKGQNAELVYSLVNSPSSPESFFAIDPVSGQLTTVKVFNRDEPDHEKELRVIVKANDKGVPSLEGTCAFVVNVLDVNDNAPMFDKSNYQETIAKDTDPESVVLRISATDADSDANGAIEYFLNASHPTDASYFSIEPRTGVITLAQPLTQIAIDYEFQLRAIARDRGTVPRSASAPVIITVKDSNTRPPTFTVLPNDTYYLPENYRDTETPIARLRAVSSSPTNPNVYYDIVHGSQEQANKFRTFVIDDDGAGGAIIKYGGSRPLDYEKIKEYTLTVRAMTEQQTGAEVTFRVALEDRNDEVPIFYDTDRVTVTENSPPGTYVTVTTAVDADGTPPNNKVFYSFAPGSEEDRMFSIDSTTGKISTRIRFDREDRSRDSPFYTIVVIAKDGAPSDIRQTSEPNQAKQRVTIEIGDENDNGPYFDTNGIYRASVDENADVGAKVIDVTAKDIDDDSRIKYQITAGNYGAVFDIDPDTGTVKVKNKLDYENVRNYSITVTASDGKFEATQTVLIEVMNVNDVAPVFDQPGYELQLREGYISPEPIIKVTAIDPDPVGRAAIVYKLSGPGIYPNRPEDDVFSINSRGEVVVLKALDRDEGTGGREVWDLSVLAWDDDGNGLGSSVPFKLTLTDINDNAPYLIQSNSTPPVIMENKSPEGVVIPVEAEDFDDQTRNGPPYSFLLDPAAPAELRRQFSVTTVANRAEIRPLVKFDREKQKQYAIPVVVSDNELADPRALTGTSLFTVIIGDENDNDMRPGSSAIQVFNFEGKMPDTVVGRVYVDDPDDWDLPDKTFSWLAGQEYRHFELDRDTGNITMRYGTPNGSYPLQFQVYDKKFQSTVTADVTVTVRLLPREAVTQSGSLRFAGVSAERFITDPDKNTPSMYRRLIAELARLFSTAPENVDLFGVQDNGAGGVDVRYAAHGSPYYRAERMDGIVSQNKKQLEEMLKVEIDQVGIDDCLFESTCRGSCHSHLKIFDNEVYRVQTNTSSIIGVRTQLQYTCGQCEPPMPREVCLNDGRWDETQNKCECPEGYPGPNCEGLTIHFEGTGYAWFPRLTACNASHLGFDLTTSTDEGLILYNGPLLEPTGNVHDYFAIDLHEGRLRVFLNFGAATAVASPQTAVNDGKRHHVDITWDTQTVTVLVDSCVGVPECQAAAAVPGSSRFLNVAAPLQLGGSAVPLDRVQSAVSWDRLPGWGGFTGCIQNMTFLDRVFDLSHPSYGKDYSNYCMENVKPQPVIETTPSFLIAFLCCLVCLLLLVLAVIMFRRRNVRTLYKEPTDEMRDTIINYDDEGGGEKDQTAYDLSVLQVANGPSKSNGQVGRAPPVSVRDFIDDNRQKIDSDDSVWPPDDVRNYAYEGGGSSAGSLSSINSGTDDNDQNYDYLNEFGPRFRKLADMYGGGEEEEGEGERPPRPPAVRPSSVAGESWC